MSKNVSSGVWQLFDFSVDCPSVSEYTFAYSPLPPARKPPEPPLTTAQLIQDLQKVHSYPWIDAACIKTQPRLKFKTKPESKYMGESRHQDHDNQPIKDQQNEQAQVTARPIQTGVEQEKGKLNEQDRQRVLKFIEGKRTGSRSLSDTMFREYFGKQVMHNYGRQNTHKHNGGIIYGNYLKSHNINPHTGKNHPLTYQSYPEVVRLAKRMKKATEEDRLQFIKKSNFRSLQLGEAAGSQKLLFQMQRASDLLYHGTKPSPPVSAEVLDYVHSLQKNTMIEAERVRPPDDDLDKIQEQNRTKHRGNGFYLVESREHCKSTKCHGFYKQRSKASPRKQTPKDRYKQAVRINCGGAQNSQSQKKTVKARALSLAETPAKQKGETSPFQLDRRRDQECLQKSVLARALQSRQLFNSLLSLSPTLVASQQICAKEDPYKLNPQNCKVTVKALGTVRRAGIGRGGSAN